MSDLVLLLSDSWAYTVFRMICLIFGMVGFLIGCFKSMQSFFFCEGRGFMKWFTIGFACALVGWGALMFIGIHYDLSECETTKLVVGKLTNCELE